jgi:hypothetical protein
VQGDEGSEKPVQGNEDGEKSDVQKPAPGDEASDKPVPDDEVGEKQHFKRKRD